MNILIAEDHPILQLLSQKLMHNWGFDFDMASDGVEAVEYAQKNAGHYDLCIMDVEMPRVNRYLGSVQKLCAEFGVIANNRGHGAE